MKLKVLPCPFCGHQYKGNVFSHADYPSSFECPECGAEGPYPEQPKNMKAKDYDYLCINAWNRRVEKCN